MKPLKGQDCIRAARDAGLEVREAKGSHIKIMAPEGRGYQVVYPGEMSVGVSCSVRKWFKALGILVVLGLAAMLCVYTGLLP